MIDVQFMPSSYRHSCILTSETEKSFPIIETTTLPAMRSEFGQRLFDARKHANLTQMELAKAVGTSQPNLAELERKGAGSALTPAFATRCGVAIEWLAYGQGDMLARETERSGGGGGHSTLSEAALSIAALFDLIPVRDKIRRAQAQADATNAILAVLQPQRANAPVTPDSPRPIR